MQTMRSFLARAAVLFACAYAVSGCLCRAGYPCDMSDAGGDGAADPQAAAEMLMQRSCASAACHNPGGAGGIDLVSPGVNMRVVNHASSCNGQIYVVPMHPETSYLIRKAQPMPPCGSVMPLGTSGLSAADLQTLTDWINSLTP